MTSKKWIRKYCREESASIWKIEIPDWQAKGNDQTVASMKQRLKDIAAVRQFLRRYPHEELDFNRFPCANGTEVLEAIWGYRDAWDAALAAHRPLIRAVLLKVHHAMKPDLKNPVGETGEIVSEVSVAGLEKKYLVQFPGARQEANRFWIKARYLELQETSEEVTV